MRTLERNHTKENQVGEHLIPCCGHFLVFTEDTEEVYVGGCPSGIDWEVIRAKAKQVGLACESDLDAHEALFHVGVTSRDTISETSGRGVGMAAIRECCRSLGGSIEINSRLGEGTEFRFVFPVENMAHEMHTLLSRYGIENPNAITCNTAAQNGHVQNAS